MTNDRLLWQLHPAAFCRSELAFFTSAAEKECLGRLALLLLPVCRVSMAMVRRESKVQSLLAHCHWLGFGHHKITKVGRDLWQLCVLPALRSRRLNWISQGQSQPAEMFVVTHKVGGTLI